MKTAYSVSYLEQFLSHKNLKVIKSITQLKEGESSQVFKFDVGDEHRVLRIRGSLRDLEADVFAYDNFQNRDTPVPYQYEVGLIDDNFYAISEYISGSRVSDLSDTDFANTLPNVHRTLGAIYNFKISGSGYGDIDPHLGNAAYTSWRARLTAEINELGGPKTLIAYAEKISLPAGTIEKLLKEFEQKLPFISETRRLLHGDPCNDNFMVNGDKIIAVLDWEQMAYGDWVRDFSRLSAKYGDIRAFANEYRLEAEYIDERVSVYRTINMLRDIEFAATQNKEHIAKRLRSQL